MKTERYRYDRKHEYRFPLELIAIDFANSFHDDHAAVVEKWIDGKWFELHAGTEDKDCFWADGIYIVCIESNTELEFDINELWRERAEQVRERDCQRDDTEATRQLRTYAQGKIGQIEAAIGKLQEQRETMLSHIDDDCGYDINAGNYEDTINILSAINHALQLDYPLYIFGRRLCFRTGPFAKVHPTTLYFACNEFRRFAKAKGLISE